MELIGYLIFIWALTQSIWLTLRWLNRKINPPKQQFNWMLSPISYEYFREYAEQEIVALLSKQAHDEMCAIEDARVFENLKVH